MSKINIYASDSRGQEEKREECFSFFPLGVGDGVRSSSSWKLQDVGWTKQKSMRCEKSPLVTKLLSRAVLIKQPAARCKEFKSEFLLKTVLFLWSAQPVNLAINKEERLEFVKWMFMAQLFDFKQQGQKDNDDSCGSIKSLVISDPYQLHYFQASHKNSRPP